MRAVFTTLFIFSALPLRFSCKLLLRVSVYASSIFCDTITHKLHRYDEMYDL